jgi:putative ABC transport system permease protein
VGAGLLIRSLSRLRAVNPGFDPEGLVTFVIFPPQTRPLSPAGLTALYREIQDAARALPGVTSTALTNFTPLGPGGLPSLVEIAGRAPDPVRDPQVLLMTVSPGYFRTMRIPLRAGRELTEADLSAGPAVIVNEAFARAFWQGQDPIGRQLTLHKAVQGRPDFGEPLPSTVVGVVGDVHHFGLDTPAEPQVYVPFTRNVWGHMSLVVRTTTPPAGLIATLRRTVRQVDPDIPMTLGGGTSAVETFDVAAGLGARRLDTWLLGSFAASALILAAIGVYGLFAYSIAQRRREIGIRVALGASRSHVFRLVVGDGLRLAGLGIAFGAGGALVLTRLLAGLLYGIGPSDPGTFIAAATLLGLVALLACYLPARRATRVDPVVELRTD